MRKRELAFEVVLLLSGGVVRGIKLKVESDYAVRRDLLELSYPAYKSFRGLMHSGLMPATAVIDDKSIGRDDFSSYFFVLLRPDGDESNDAEERTDETFRNDTLLIWLNGGPGVSWSMTMPRFCPGSGLSLACPSFILHSVFKYDWIDGRDGAGWNAKLWPGYSFAQSGTSCKKQIRVD
jgi:hypothetical protein